MQLCLHNRKPQWLKNRIWYCCDCKAWAASVQSFTLWQQATIETMRHNHSIIACLCHIYMGVSGESHIQHNANWEVATTSLLFTVNRTNRTYFCEGRTWLDFYILVTAPFGCDWKAQAASAQSFTLWQQATIEIMQSLYYCLFVPDWCCCSSRTSCSWWITHSTQRQRRGCNNIN